MRVPDNPDIASNLLILAELLTVLKALKRGDCWCEMGIGNPMMSRHSPGCLSAQAAIAKAEGRIDG